MCSALVIPSLDKGKAELSSAEAIFPWTDDEGYKGALVNAMRHVRSKGKVIGSELALNLGQMDQFKSALDTTNFVAISEEISSLRQIKDQEEIELTKKAAKVLSTTYKEIPDIIREGQSEAEASHNIRLSLIKKGAYEIDFCAVQSGENSAVPHSQVTQRKIKKGDIIVIDITCTNRDGYYSDFTRTFVVGKPTREKEKVYEVVREAQRLGREACVSGAQIKEIDQAAREKITKAGYGKYFTHRTGHGLGLDVHEAPWIRGDNEHELERDMIFTVEPGVYLQGKFGIRIEDDIVMQKKTGENITLLGHELPVI